MAVIFAVLVGGEAFGFGGMLVAVPVVGVIRVILENVKPSALHPGAEAPILDDGLAGQAHVVRREREPAAAADGDR